MSKCIDNYFNSAYNSMYKEDEYTELKSILTKDIKKEIAAFANSGGGKIYIGVDDDGNIMGLDNIKKDIEALSGMIQDGIKLDLTLYTNIVQEKINEKSVPASDEVIKKLIMDSQNIPFEDMISKNQSLHFNYLTEIFNEKNIDTNDTTLNIMHTI